jgi:hypothetical protein
MVGAGISGDALVYPAVSRQGDRDQGNRQPIARVSRGIQDFNYRVGEFFDRALYHVARGFEAEAFDVARRPEMFATT